MTDQLPDYHDPPVVEIVAAVQFVPLPRFGMPEIIALARSFDGWQIFDAPPALDPIVEAEPGTGASMSFRLGVSTSSKLLEAETFVGRLHIAAESASDETGQLHLQLGLISRRYIRGNDLGDTLACHRDIVMGFTAVTTDDMHKIWGRFR